MPEPGSAPAASVFVKRRADAPPSFFGWESAGLDWLRAAGGVAVVDVLSFDAQSIALNRIDEKPATAAAAEAFGRDLAATHAGGAAAFGAGPPGWSGTGFIGRQQLALQPFSRWGEFFAEIRLLPFARAAVKVGNLDAGGVALIERVCARLVAGEFDDDRAPARIHGDLWGGNVLYTAAGAVLIDPAAHGGHGLTDIAMLALFGTERLARVQASYVEAAGMSPGWQDLIGLHQLHPLLVHAVTHSASYGQQARKVAEHYA